ncbi:FUSC family protein [Legionella fallonii]|uniref:FUSC family protein n=1 Tax=Legionella fallonii TaxID=96230 RepID=UPI0005D2EBD9|nr:FUSC family protein [Legionella fallonii]
MSSFWPKSVENRAALRTAVAAFIAVFISFYLHLQTPYWSGMTVVIVTNLYTGSIIDKATMRIIGTIAGAFLGFFVAGMVVNSFLLYLLSCFLILAVSVYYYHFSTYGYAYLLGALCAFVIIAQLALDPRNAFFVAIWRPVEIGIGVLVSALSAYAIFPNHLKDNIVVQVRGIFDDFSTEFKQLSQSLKQGTIDFEVVAQSNLKIKKKLRKAVELIGALNHEIGVTKERIDQLRAFLDSFYDLSRQLQYLILTSPLRDDLTTIQTLQVEPVFAAIQDDLALLQFAFINQLAPSAVLKTPEAIAVLEKQWSQEQQKLMVKSDFISSFIHFLEQVSFCFSQMYSLLAGSPVTSTARFKLINRKERLRSDLDLVKHSIKAGLAVILALLFWMVSNWPGGLNGIISSLVISIRKNLFEMTYISFHRIIGCCLGGGVALFSLLVCAMDLYDFSLVLLFSVWAFSYLMFKFPKYAYIGLQANIALIISLAQEGGPPILLDPPLQRLGGIFIGITSSFLVANILWRSDVLTLLNRSLDKLYRFMTYNLKQILTVTEKEITLHDLANLFWLSRGLIESLTAERLNAKKQNKLVKLTRRFESLVFIQATLSHILAAIDRVEAEATAKLFDLDLLAIENKLVILYEDHDIPGGHALSHQLQEMLATFEAKPVYVQIDSNELRNFLAYINALNHLALGVQ